jgi:hypothetical protein
MVAASGLDQANSASDNDLPTLRLPKHVTGASPHLHPFVIANSSPPSLEPIGNLGANVLNSNLTLVAASHGGCSLRDVTRRIR